MSRREKEGLEEGQAQLRFVIVLLRVISRPVKLRKPGEECGQLFGEVCLCEEQESGKEGRGAFFFSF